MVLMPVITAIVTKLAGGVSLQDVLDFFTFRRMNETTIQSYETTTPNGASLIRSPKQLALLSAVRFLLMEKNIIARRSICNIQNVDHGSDVEFAPIDECEHDGFYISEQKHEGKDKYIREIVTTMKIRTRRPPKDIKEFLATARKNYKRVCYDNHPHVYFVSSSGSARYALNTNTSFDSIFYEGKDKIIKVVEDVENGTLLRGGLLLYGEPGCGKTSTIKAIAHATGRSVFMIKLSDIKSDRDLMNVFHNKTIAVTTREGFPVSVRQVPLDRRIYVLEDIDAETEIVKRRETEPLQSEKSAADASAIAAVADAITRRRTPGVVDIEKSTLTLSGILNVLDGIPELQSAIIIMTTNHVEKLDPALIRHGRVSVQVKLGRMHAPYSYMLVKKYFPDFAGEIPDNVFKPSVLESICQLAQDADDAARMISEGGINVVE